MRVSYQAICGFLILASSILWMELPARALFDAPGDANSDSQRNALDVFKLADHIHGDGPAPITNCDLNADGELNDSDLKLLAEKVVGQRVLATDTIGPDGGVLSSGKVRLEIPAGAFGYTTTLTLLEGHNPDPEVTASQYFIDGLPFEFGDINLQIPAAENSLVTDAGYQRSADGLPSLSAQSAQNYIMIDAEGLVMSKLEQTVKAVIDQADSCATTVKNAVCTTISDAYLSVRDGTGNQLGIFSLVYDVRKPSTKGYFELFLKSKDYAGNEATVKAIADLLDGLRDSLADEFKMPWPAGTKSIRVLFRPFPVDNQGKTDAANAIASKLSASHDFIEVNKNFLTTGVTDELRATLAHELMHLLQTRYDPRFVAIRRTIGDWASAGNVYLWWNEAVSTYCETRFGGIEYPENASNQVLEPFLGLNRGKTKQERQDHGYGMASLVQYIAEKYGPGMIGEIYKEMKNYWFWFADGKYPEQVLLEQLGIKDENDLSWWHQYLSEYLRGSIYKGVALGLLGYGLKKDPKQSLTPLETPATLPRAPVLAEIQDLGAKVWWINTTNLTLSSNNTLTFAAPKLIPFDWWYPGDAGLMVFEWRTTEVIWLAGDGTEPLITVPNAAEILERGSNIVLMVFNNRHTGDLTGKQTLGTYHAVGRKYAMSYRCPNAEVEFVWSGIKSIFKWNVLANQNTNHLAEFPDFGRDVTFNVSVHSTGCEKDYKYWWSFSLFGDYESREITCGAKHTRTVTVRYDANLLKSIASFTSSYQALGGSQQASCSWYAGEFVLPAK